MGVCLLARLGMRWVSYEGQSGPLRFREHTNWRISDDTQLTRNYVTTRLLETVLTYLPDSRVRDRIAELKSLPNDLPVAEVASQYGSSGYVVESVPLALYGTETIASITGQIAGAWIGASQIPKELINSLPAASDIESVFDTFAETIE